MEEYMTAFDMVSSTLEMLGISRTNRPKSVCLAQMGITIIRTSLFLQLLILQGFSKLAAHHNNLKQKTTLRHLQNCPIHSILRGILRHSDFKLPEAKEECHQLYYLKG